MTSENPLSNFSSFYKSLLFQISISSSIYLLFFYIIINYWDYCNISDCVDMRFERDWERFERSWERDWERFDCDWRRIDYAILLERAQKEWHWEFAIIWRELWWYSYFSIWYFQTILSFKILSWMIFYQINRCALWIISTQARIFSQMIYLLYI